MARQQVANLRSQLSHVPANVASRVLHDTHLTRRHVLKGLLLLLGVGGGWQLWQSETGEGLRADYRTDKGAVSHQLLEDDSQLTLNTQSAADVPLMYISALSTSGTAKLLSPPQRCSAATFPRDDPLGSTHRVRHRIYRLLAGQRHARCRSTTRC